MQRQRGGLVPAAEALADLPGPDQARCSFTVADQVNQLVSAREADPDRGFMARLMALCSLPRTNPGSRTQYKRVNGPYKLILSRTGEYKLPYGNLPAPDRVDGFQKIESSVFERVCIPRSQRSLRHPNPCTSWDSSEVSATGRAR